MGRAEYFDPTTQSRKPIKAGSIVSDAGLEYTPDQIKVIDNKIGILNGAGATKEKANKTDLDEHKAEKATDTELGHVKAGTNVTIEDDGTINAKGGNVDSVNEKKGAVVLTATDVGAVSNFSDTIKTLTLKNGWTGRISYLKNALGDVYLNCDNGLRAGTEARNTVIGTLPTGYRPIAYTLYCGTFGDAGLKGVVRIESSGNITIDSTSFTGGTFVVRFPSRASS